MKKLVTVLAVMVMAGSMIFWHSLTYAMADEAAGPAKERCYKSIKIDQGDSLWAIASEYSRDMDTSIQEYIEELKQMNGLKGDTIHAGNHLTVVYLAETD